MASQAVPSWTALPAFSVGAGPSTVPSATSTAHDAHNAPRGRKRRPEQVYKLLTEYYETVTQRPKKPERLELAAKVRQIPGCEDYTEQDVAVYFAGKRQSRKSRKSDGTAPANTPADILYPSLRNRAVLSKLDVLLNSLPIPTMDIAVIWAQRIGAEPTDIITYAQLRAASTNTPTAPVSVSAPTVSTPPVPKIELPRLQSFRRSLASQLPTPAASTSPEPRTPTSPLTESKRSTSIKEEDELESDEYDAEEMYPDVSTEGLEAGRNHNIPFDSRLHDLAIHLREALLAPTPPEQMTPPKTFAELARWFKQQQAVSESLLDGITKGTYPRLGLGIPPSTHGL